MKKVLSLLFAMLLVCAACTKEEKNVVGTWELVNSDIPGENVLELKEDGSGCVRGGESEEEYAVQWTRDGDKIYLAAEGENEVGVYEVVSGDGKTLVLSIDGDLFYFKKKSSGLFGWGEEKDKDKEEEKKQEKEESVEDILSKIQLGQ